MAVLWGLDCLEPTCVHDTAYGYRLSFKLRRAAWCLRCKRPALPLPPQVVAPNPQPITNMVQCPLCSAKWQTNYQRERNDLVFQHGELPAAQAQMRVLGCKDHVEPGYRYLIEEHPSIPPGYDQRVLELREEPLPKTALYFRWRPDAGQMLTPDLVFQCAFPPNATAMERRTAPERKLDPDQYKEIVMHGQGMKYDTDGSIVPDVQVFSTIRCQHCNRPLPTRALSLTTLRAVSLGD